MRTHVTYVDPIASYGMYFTRFGYSMTLQEPLGRDSVSRHNFVQTFHSGETFRKGVVSYGNRRVELIGTGETHRVGSSTRATVRKGCPSVAGEAL